MALTNAFREAVAEGSVRKIRIMLKDSMLVDPTFSRFDEMVKAASAIEGLYDEHDGRGFNENPDEWDDAYMDKLMVQVVGNFSHERIAHLKKVVRKLRPVPEKVTSPESITGQKTQEVRRTSEYQEQKKRDQEEGNYKYAVGAGVGACVGGVVGCVGGTMASLPIAGVVGCTVGGAAIGAAAGGAVVYLTNGKE